MGNQFVKRKTNIDPLVKITNNNKLNEIDTTTPSTQSNRKVTDMTLRNEIWKIIDSQQDYDVMSDFILGTIIPPTADGVLPSYQKPTDRPIDPVSAQNIFGSRVPNRPIYVNQLKAFCTLATDDSKISPEPNVVSYALPMIATEFSRKTGDTNLVPPDRVFDDNALYTDTAKTKPK